VSADTKSLVVDIFVTVGLVLVLALIEVLVGAPLGV
jgi:hypothetical protein